MGQLSQGGLRRLQFMGLGLEVALLRRQSVIGGLKLRLLFLQGALERFLRLLAPR